MGVTLVTGGAGYIGSHTCVELLGAGHDVVILDDLSNASPEAVRRIEELAGRPLRAFVQGDVRDASLLETVFGTYPVESVIHFAAKKAVGESVAQPLAYYDNNLQGLMRLLQAMDAAACRRIVFSSSATVYGDPARVPIDESFPTTATNPYGWTKLMGEQILRDLAASDERWNVVLLRYFNPVGAHSSGRIGEDPDGLPNNLMPYVSQVAVGRLSRLKVFGGDYPTPDGTGVRDYIHVVDLALGHLKALERMGALSGVTTLNLGTGRGYSVLEMVRAFEQASGRPVPFDIVERRSGDVAACWADPARAAELLGWRAERGLATMCEDAWRWQSANPRGYRN
ncbi:UDP-glucose 4-epimerase GalE [Thauera linaloolentis]|uniref:UDP-glucose 4-epimerase n=1 Tax=Thauera linaloolentis (strain DSM 12138 / JCM 21573 / CCUG 41526 / CIP 105981 / IAM 15112 / NBRC 102519 / 47Lol) TaxID=1123367 RepID=N6Y8J8_THAL4|nr:UDP-glucose 4-epimerase GalE [Thauera linaloolentis]ENO90631.1 UDP-glucose 4-epimerase [Thauera linaloolentis 47Lol = DSM 12138]MCM8566137.1 UDP-glucose 4-epimerase GalE [Thauera linaloolentis]